MSSRDDFSNAVGDSIYQTKAHVGHFLVGRLIADEKLDQSVLSWVQIRVMRRLLTYGNASFSEHRPFFSRTLTSAAHRDEHWRSETFVGTDLEHKLIPKIWVT